MNSKPRGDRKAHSPQDWEALLEAERQKTATPFDLGAGPAFAAVTLFIVLIAWAMSDDGWVPLLDSANLVFHEAGHPIFGLLGSTMGLYGGTLGQLAFPVAVIVKFWRDRNHAALALGWVWLFENWLNIARYMADARARELPLVGGGDHDWFNIFLRWDVLQHDTDIAGFVQFCAWCGIFAVWAWTGWRWLAGGRSKAKAIRVPTKQAQASGETPTTPRRISDEKFQQLQDLRNRGAITEEQFAQELRRESAKS
jgi:hypothetical protein